MIGWTVAHQQTVGTAGLGFMAGVVFAAWRQLTILGRQHPPRPYDHAEQGI